MRRTNCNVIAVGDAIAAPQTVARGGTIVVRSEEAANVARWFGLGAGAAKERSAPRRNRKRRIDPTGELELRPGTITLITGPSGSGKSSLLRTLRQKSRRPKQDAQRAWIDLTAVRVANVPVVNCFGDQPVMETLQLLGRVGLGEAWSYLRTPAELSEGQKFRLRLAVGLWRATRIGERVEEEVAESAATDERRGADFDDLSRVALRGVPLRSTDLSESVLVCDEFAAVLDRLTAMIVARCLRRAIDAHRNIAAVVATSHEDLVEALQPDVLVRCDFGRVDVETV